MSSNPETFKLNQIISTHGCLSIMENLHQKFIIKRTYILSHLLKDQLRGNHAHKKLKQVFIPIDGTFEITLTNLNREEFLFSIDPSVGLFVPPLHWRVIRPMQNGAILLVLASENYIESDYIRDKENFLHG